MAKFIFSASVLFAIVLFLSSFSGIFGFEDILVSNCEDLQNINLNLVTSYIVTQDIDCRNSSEWNSGAGFLPIGSDTSEGFCGAFNGQNYTISHLFINMPDDNFVGLFAQCCVDANIHDVMLSDVTMTGNEDVGGLAGVNYGSISNIIVTGNVRGGYLTGGVVGYSRGQMAYLEFTGDVNYFLPGEIIGGVVGMQAGKLIHGKATGNVQGRYNIGGAVGLNGDDQAYLMFIEFTGEVFGEVLSQRVGGLVGELQGTLIQGFVHANVSGTYYFGGVIGVNFGQASELYFTGYVTGTDSSDWLGGLVGYNIGFINDTATLGTITGGAHIGGVCGINFNDITFSEFSGNVVGIGSSSNIGGFMGHQGNGGFVAHSKVRGTIKGEELIGGFVGSNSGRLESIEFEGEVIGETFAQQIGGLVGLHADTGSLIGGSVHGSVYGNKYVGGIVGDTFGKISSVEFSGTIRGYGLAQYMGGLVGYQESSGYLSDAKSNATINGTSFVGGAAGWNLGVLEDITFTGTIIGEKGSYNIGGVVGLNERTINNAFIHVLIRADGMKVGGAVGENIYTGTLENITVITDLVARGGYAGGVVGNNLGNMFFCRAEGSVQANSYVGGVAGSNGIAGIIAYSYAIVNVTSQTVYAGGLIGYHEGVLAYSYSLGPVTANQTAGSLVGYFDGRMQESYAAGCVTTFAQAGGLVGSELAQDQVTEPYWNLDTTGQRYPAGLSYDAVLQQYGLTNEQMVQPASFKLWDYDETWSQQPGESFPYLKNFVPNVLPVASTRLCPMEPLPYEPWMDYLAIFFSSHLFFVLVVLFIQRIQSQNQLHSAFKDTKNWIFSEIKMGNVSLMSYFVHQITQSRECDHEGYSRLAIATLSDATSMVKYWLEKLDGSKINQKQAAYAIAQDLNYTDSAILLRPDSENIDMTTVDHGTTKSALRSRSVNQSDSIMVPLLGESGDSFSIDNQLYVAATTGDIRKVRYCLMQRAEPNRRNQEGMLPIFSAAKNYHTNVILLLVEHGANPFLRNNEQQTIVEFLFTLNLNVVAEVIIKHSRFSAAWSLSKQIHLKAIEDKTQYLTEVNLSGYGLYDHEFVRFLVALKNNPYVKKFNVAYNLITVHGLQDSAPFLIANKTLSTLDLRCNLITLQGACDFKAMLAGSSLRVILSDNLLLPEDHQEWQSLTATSKFRHKPRPKILLCGKLFWQYFYINALMTSLLIVANRISSGYLIQAFDKESDHFHFRMTIALLCLSYVPSIYALHYLYGGWWLRNWRDGVQGLLLLPSLSPELLSFIYQVQSPDIMLSLLEITALSCEILIATFAMTVIERHEDFRPALFKIIVTIMLVLYKCLSYNYWREILKAQWHLWKKSKGGSMAAGRRESQLLQL